MMEQLGNIKQIPSAGVLFLLKAPPAARRLMLACLRFSPDKRPSAETCLEDPFVEKFHLQEAEPTCDKVIRKPIADDNKMKAADYRQHIYNQISNRKQQAKLDEFAAGGSKEKRKASKDRSGSPSIEQPWMHEGGAEAPPTTPNGARLRQAS